MSAYALSPSPTGSNVTNGRWRNSITNCEDRGSLFGLLDRFCLASGETSVMNPEVFIGCKYAQMIRVTAPLIAALVMNVRALRDWSVSVLPKNDVDGFMNTIYPNLWVPPVFATTPQPTSRFGVNIVTGVQISASLQPRRLRCAGSGAISNRRLRWEAEGDYAAHRALIGDTRVIVRMRHCLISFADRVVRRGRAVRAVPTFSLPKLYQKGLTK